MLGMLGNIRTG